MSNLSFESMIEQINSERKKLSSSTSFDEISKTWNFIKKQHSECDKVLNDLSKKITTLESNAYKEVELNVSFEEAFEEIKKISELSKTTPILELPKLVEKMQNLKNFCLKKIEEESVKVIEQ